MDRQVWSLGLTRRERERLEYKKLGRFTIDRPVAKGGMGEVILSTDDRGLPIALKTILESYQQSEKFRDMFIREAEITFCLDHPNIVRAYRFEKLGNRLVMALEWLDGVNLREVLKKLYERKLQMPVPVAIAIMQRVLAGLHYSHTKLDDFGNPLGIIHRDLNPSNVFVTYTGEVKILDFGISKATMKEVHQLSPRQELKGKISYLAPEQIKGKHVDHRCDLFTAGVVLWEMLAARPLYVRPTDQDAMAAILNGEYLSLQGLRADVAPALESVIRMALETDPRKRPKDAQKFSEMLNQVARSAMIPGVGEEEISAFVRSLFAKVENREDLFFKSAYSWLLTLTPGQEEKGLESLKALAVQNPTIPYVQLNYARALLTKGDRQEGLRLMRKLARVDSLEQDVQNILEWLGVRRKPVFTALKRSHPANRTVGWIRHKILGPTTYQQEFLAA